MQAKKGRLPTVPVVAKPKQVALVLRFRQGRYTEPANVLEKQSILFVLQV